MNRWETRRFLQAANRSRLASEDMTEVAKVALVTGCSSGIGKATAWALAEAGYRVYATSRRLVDMGQVMKEAEESKLPLHARTLDVTR